jgi:LuxR family maltose regulon positive regulatory protein
MQLLITQWLAHASPGPLWDYATRLLSQFDAEPHGITAAQKKVSPVGAPSANSGQALVEPLTPRELEVLRLLAQGFSNRQIAEKLVVAEGTVKFYVHAVLKKLEVHSRTQAIAKARELNLL